MIFIYSPFENRGKEIGPVVANKNDVRPYNDIHSFPPEIKADKKSFPLLLVGYNQNQKMIFTKLVCEAAIEA